jgi:integrase
MSESPVWRDVERQAAKCCTSQEKEKASPATFEEVDVTVKRLMTTNDPAAHHRAAQLAIMWATACRPGCLLQLQRRDIQLEAHALHVVFKRGKGHEMGKAPHPVHTILPALWVPIVAAVLAARQPEEFLWLFPSWQARCLGTKALTHDLRQTRPALQARSLRRGALMRMASSGVSEAQLLAFSDHAEVRTLREYIGVTREVTDRAQVMMTGANHLLGGTTSV